MPLQLKHLGSDMLQLIYSFDDTYRQYYSKAVVPMINGFVVAYCQGCQRWLDGNSEDDEESNRKHYSSPVGSPPEEDSITVRFQAHLAKQKHYTRDIIPTFYNIQTAYCHQCEGWIISRKY